MTMSRMSLWRIAGAPLLVIISLYGLAGHMLERRHRVEVVAHGREAEAQVVKSSGLESVLVKWTDSSGQHRTADAWTGKPFARQARAGQRVAIRYDADQAMEPVILSEAAERERVNAWWISADLGVAIAMTVICLVVGVLMLAGARSRVT
jgi:hypothetical protein